ncbi:stage III sporulation protein AF [Bovifimicola ammoniilytica]|uniref:stage III sporulation protein AF n=1 Tax=Bovifimicola ammoniilytica TaxID=2981720 RepID=UPI0011CB6397|nr:stage III sporulation protein AF [Bovifimicola ammoniilytica]
MKDVIREIAVFTIFINIVSCIIPGDNYKRYLKLISGIIIIIIVMKPIFRYNDGNELYNAFIKEYEKNQVVELDKSLRNLNKKIADITISDYEREVSEDIVTFLTKKGFKVSDVDISLIVDDDNRLGVKKLLIEFEDMNYDKNLREATTIYIDDIILEKYNIDKEVIEIKY